MEPTKIYYTWYKVTKDLEVISESESTNFDHSPNSKYILWIEKSGPHGYFPTPDIYDDAIYHYQFFNENKEPIEKFHVHNEWYLVGISTILEFRESYYRQFHIQDPKKTIGTRKVWSETSRGFNQKLCFIRDEFASFDSWEAYEAAKNT